MEKKTVAFQAEIKQMLNLVIHSLYSKKEIFLRELISNASDAIDRARYAALTDKEIASSGEDWKIDIILDKDDKILTIADNGMGMNAEELDKNLGVIASSGTKSFLEAVKKNSESDIPQMIGQFGVGFYSAFMVAKSVSVITLKRGESQALKWTSDGNGEYTVEAAARSKPGTSIVLELREDAAEYLDAWRIRELVKKYSDFIAYPIRLGEKGETPADSEEPLNTRTALWKRPKSEIKAEEYAEFYKHLSHDHEEPMRTIHMNVEGVIEFKALLFIPKSAPYDLFMPERKYGLQLYVRNVFIGADLDLLLPSYLRFVKGVVDSSDLPLNVSREMLQDDAIIRKIKSSIVNKLLGEFQQMRDSDRAGYNEFFKVFGRILKEGVCTDWENADKIKELLMFGSAESEGTKPITLDEYITAMATNQKNIYYLVADDLEKARQSPHLEAVRKRGYDVLFLTAPVDEWVIERIPEFKEKKLVAIDKGELDIGSDEEKLEEKKKLDKAAAEYKTLTDFIAERLKETVKEVRVSQRLTDSPCVLVEDGNAMSPSMERMMRAMNQEVPKRMRILEINPDHPVIEKMRALQTDQVQELGDFVDLLYAQALVAEGSVPENPRRFAELVGKLMLK